MNILKTVLGITILLCTVSLAFLGRDWDGGSRYPAVGSVVYTQMPVETPAPLVAQAAIMQPMAPIAGSPVDPAAVGGDRLVVMAAALNMRTSPNNTSGVVRSYPRGTTVAELSRNGGWIQVQTDDGVVGWMYQRYLEPAE